MEKNQNGIPERRVGENSRAMPRMDADGSSTKNGCARGGEYRGGDDRSADSCLGELKIGYAYVPIQNFRMLYSAADALSHGTLFEELYLPREVY